MVGDLGILFERSSGLKIAVVGHDLFASELAFLDPRIALGFAYSPSNNWTLSTDIVRHTDESMGDGQDYHVGFEWMPKGSGLALRIGHMWEGLTDTDAFSAGIGWKSADGLVFSYAAQKVRQVSGTGNLLHAFSVQAAL